MELNGLIKAEKAWLPINYISCLPRKMTLLLISPWLTRETKRSRNTHTHESRICMFKCARVCTKRSKLNLPAKKWRVEHKVKIFQPLFAVNEYIYTGVFPSLSSWPGSLSFYRLPATLFLCFCSCYNSNIREHAVWCDDCGAEVNKKKRFQTLCSYDCRAGELVGATPNKPQSSGMQKTR